jgi:hypothetical protein
MVGQSCRFAVTSAMASEAMPAPGVTKTSLVLVLLDHGGTAAPPYQWGEY